MGFVPLSFGWLLFLNTCAKGLSPTSGARFDIVGRLFEDDVLSVERRWRQARLFTVDRERPGEIGILACNFFPNRSESCTGQDVASVAEDTVVQQGISAAVVQAEEGGSGVAAPRTPSFTEIDVGGEHGKANVGADVSFLVEYGWAEAIEAEATAALPADALGDAALFTVNHFVQARDAMGDGVLAHFNADVAAAHLVGDGGGGAGAEEGVEDEVSGVGRDVEDALQ